MISLLPLIYLTHSSIFANVQTDGHPHPGTADNAAQRTREHYESFHLELRDIVFQRPLSTHRPLLTLLGAIFMTKVSLLV